MDNNIEQRLEMQPTESHLESENSDHLDFTQGRPFQWSDLMVLVKDPVQFYRSGIHLADQNWINNIMLAYGATSALMNFQSIKPLTLAWLMMVFAAGIGAISAWLLGGWWFNQRIKWSVNGSVKPLTGRLIYANNKLLFSIIVFPLALASALVKTFAESNLIFLVILSVATILVSLAVELVTCYNNLRSLNGLFDVKKGTAFFWFFLLPLIINGTMLIVFVRSLLRAAGYFVM